MVFDGARVVHRPVDDVGSVTLAIGQLGEIGQGEVAVARLAKS